METENKLADAIMNGKIDEARELFKNGATLTGRYVENNKSQITGRVFRSKAFDLADALIENGLIETDVYEYDSFDRSFVKSMIMNLQPDEESIAFLQGLLQKIQNKNDEVRDQTLLGYCMEEGADVAIIKCLIDAGCDVRYKNNAEMNFIHQVVRKNMLKTDRGMDYLKVLIAEGLDIDEKDVTGETPLMMAVHGNKKEYAALLLQQGANPNEQDKKGNSAFYFAVVQQQNAPLYLMLKEYASPNFEQSNQEGEQILTGFLRMANGISDGQLTLLQTMINDGADLYQTAPYYSNPKSGIDWLAEKPVEMLKTALATGAIDINRRDNQGNTLLHKVCAFNVNYETEVAKKLYQKAKLLIEAGAEVNPSNDNDETPVMLASKDNLKVKTVELLMQHNQK